MGYGAWVGAWVGVKRPRCQPIPQPKPHHTPWSYMACFFAIDQQPPLKIPVEFDWRSGVAAKDWSNVAKKGSVDAMEYELKKLAYTITSIHDEMIYLRDREREMQELNKVTNSRMAWLSFLSLFICLSVAGMQIWHLKSFFEKKKLI
ncbi:putative GOLD domain-containing protein [Helianthus annuus]|nr:putative GOLD domain-containing protein [Helianthus annuus]